MPAATIALPCAAWEAPRTTTCRRRPSPGSALRPARRPLLRLTESTTSSFVSEGPSSRAACMTQTSTEAPDQQPSFLGLSGVYPRTQASIISASSPSVSSSPTRSTTPLVAAPPALGSGITERQLSPSPAVVAPMPPTPHHHNTRRPSLTFSFVSTSTAYAELPPTPLDAPVISGGFPFPTTASPSFSSSASHNAGVAEFWADAMEGCGDEPASTVAPAVGALGLDGTAVPFPLRPLSTVSLGRKKPRREDDDHPNITTPPLAPRLAHLQPLPPPPSPIVGDGLAPLTPLVPSPASLSRGRERSRERSCERSCSIERGRERGRVR